MFVYEHGCIQQYVLTWSFVSNNRKSMFIHTHMLGIVFWLQNPLRVLTHFKRHLNIFTNSSFDPNHICLTYNNIFNF
jgi:hypothetical protein